MTAWPVAYEMHERGYSTLLTISVPDDIALVMPDDED